MKSLSLAFSPCPNDTFMFCGLAERYVPWEGEITPTLKDIEALNQAATKAIFDVSKLSCFAFGKVASRYCILRSGAALGKGCGPLLLGREGKPLRKEALIAIPGELTTAHLLLRLFLGDGVKTVCLPFHQIMPAMKKGEIDYGVVIHEGRFTYQNYGLSCLQDLGSFWEQKFDLPIPLGIIVAKRSLDKSILQNFESALSQSVGYAWDNREKVYPYVKRYAQEMDEKVIASHIDLYVTTESQRLSEKGEKAISFLLAKAVEHRLLASFAIRDCFWA